MQKELIEQLFHKFEQARYLRNWIEHWSARELQEIFGYTKWEKFSKVIEKVKNACFNRDVEVPHHFPDIRKMLPMGSGLDLLLIFSPIA